MLRGPNAEAGVCLDITEVRRRLRQGRRLALARACRARPGWRVLDAMAGFGLDGITLAALGCDVVMVERDPLLFELLEDAVRRARAELAALGPIECRLGDARELLVEPKRFDTIYLDPMFPDLGRSALPRKSAQVLAQRVGAPDPDLEELVVRSVGLARNRVVVKRRRHDPAVAPPDWQVLGRSVRFDGYRGRDA
jgi:16S rRNA (guanine1516-N2)-methyltransferase